METINQRYYDVFTVQQHIEQGGSITKIKVLYNNNVLVCSVPYVQYLTPVSNNEQAIYQNTGVQYLA